MINIIAALSENYVIGKDRKMPWYLPGDLARFKYLTMGKIVVMGRKTYESIVEGMRDKTKEPLPGRYKIVLTRDPEFKAPYCEVVTDWAHIERESNGGKEFWIIGGQEIFQIFLPITNFMYLTRVETILEGDAFFPVWNENDWTDAYDPLNMIAETGPKDQYRWHTTDLRRLA